MFLARLRILTSTPQTWGLRRVLDVDKSFGINARDGGRTRTPLAGLRILSPVRLPVPPPRRGDNYRLNPTPPMGKRPIFRILHFFATFRFEVAELGFPAPGHAELRLSNGD